MNTSSSTSKRSLIVTGKHVALSEMLGADQPSFHRWLAGNEALRRMISDPRIPTMKDQEQWYRRVQEPDRKFFSLVTLPERVLIGNCGFVDIDPKVRSAVLRITIGNPEYLGKGLGSEAVTLMLRYAFEEEAWSQVRLNVRSDNERAIRTYEKNGFRRLSENLHDDGTIITMGIDRPIL